MDIQKFQKLLDEFPLADAVKAQAMVLFQAGKKEEAIAALEKALDESNPEVAAEYKAAEKEYGDEVGAASKDFDVEMATIEAEAKQLNQDASKEIEAIRLEEMKDDIQS